MMSTLILGTHKGLLLFDTDDCEIKQEFHAGVPVSYAAVDPRTGVLWAGMDHGHWGQKLHFSNDMGATWEEVPAPAYPEGAEITDGKPATLSYVWIIAPGGKDQPERVYIGTEPGGLFQSDDGGNSFHIVEGLWNHPSRKEHWFGGGRDYPGLCSIIVDPRDSDHVFVGISVGGVFETTDGGKTWEPRNKGMIACYLPDPHAEVGHDPHFVVASPSNPDVMWQQNHCGVFRTTDGARTWENVSQSGGPVHFGFAIAADEKDSDVAWVIPAVSDEKRVAIDRALVVCRTDDGGKTWKQFRSGLPQTNCYDLVFRHALDVKGDKLAFGTTNGNVYLSEDRGESWRCLGTAFAPVYSVRFA
jgi:photosystem II stability/assembly factor-like uncharacterized protein